MQLCKNKKERGLFIPHSALLRGPHLPKEEVMVDFPLPKETQAWGPGVMEELREMPQPQKACPGEVIDLAPASWVGVARSCARLLPDPPPVCAGDGEGA